MMLALGASLMLNPGLRARTQTQFQAYTALRLDRSVITSLPAMNVSKQLELLMFFFGLRIVLNLGLIYDALSGAAELF